MITVHYLNARGIVYKSIGFNVHWCERVCKRPHTRWSPEVCNTAYKPQALEMEQSHVERPEFKLRLFSHAQIHWSSEMLTTLTTRRSNILR